MAENCFLRGVWPSHWPLLMQTFMPRTLLPPMARQTTYPWVFAFGLLCACFPIACLVLSLQGLRHRMNDLFLQSQYGASIMEGMIYCFKFPCRAFAKYHACNSWQPPVGFNPASPKRWQLQTYFIKALFNQINSRAFEVVHMLACFAQGHACNLWMPHVGIDPTHPKNDNFIFPPYFI